MAFELPPLGYAFDALEPFIDAQTMEIHHDRHHKAYVDNLNAALKDLPQFEGKSIEQILRNIDDVPADKKQAVINHGGGHHNHTLFWETLKKGVEGPSGDLKAAIDADLGGVDAFKAAFETAAKTRFGSGWAWLVVDGGGKLAVQSTLNQDSPLMQGHTPILGIDVWEHAYYLKYQNKRPDYVSAFWNVVNWDKVAALYAAAK